MSSAKKAAEEAIEAIGLGYDLGFDLRLKYCKKNSPRLIVINYDDKQVRDMVIPGGFSLPNVPKSIKCDKGERLRFSSDVLSFQQMSEQFNQELSLSGKIPSGHFNAAFEFSGVWQKDAANTKALAFDGVNITLYSIALEKSQFVLCDHVKEAVPSSWEPSALARFIEKYGTHAVVGIKMGGKDMIYVKQQHSSPLQPVDVQKKLKDMADRIFIDGGRSTMNSDKFSDREKLVKQQGLAFMDQFPSSSYSHTEDIKFISKRKVDSLTHAINLYIRYKPPIEELHQFLEFQLPRLWAPLYVNTTPVDVGKKPVTGVRLYLEGKRSNCLAIHLQHLSSLPKTFRLADERNGKISDPSSDQRYYEKLKWKSFSHICTAPVESDDDLSIVTGAEFEVGESALVSQVHKKQPPQPIVNINSAVYPGGPPVAAQTPKLLKFVDTTEMTRGPQDSPGYWVVSGAKLNVDNGKISLRVKYSLLSLGSPDDDVSIEM
ncbi:MACPF DOMAIN-CONTAINING PROTEIN CAD1 [Salix koriyanagi]|uniref:MACPF DOMAIN-CONTAINING PROTEIN CAD1 n=1 Tax=Salix koriyanagi TaxID=2511006 RepID=A0A9Q0X1D0_9ROSI|nr:MACPF DOMAIN-CONTAINING PROTEIN CAD1 [Salix koriyanagi]